MVFEEREKPLSREEAHRLSVAARRSHARNLTASIEDRLGDALQFDKPTSAF